MSFNPAIALAFCRLACRSCHRLPASCREDVSGGTSSQKGRSVVRLSSSIAAQRAIYQTANKGDAIARAAVVTVASVIDRSVGPVIAASVSAAMTAASVSGMPAHCVSAPPAHCMSAHSMSGAVTTRGVVGGERVSCQRHTTERHRGSKSDDCFMRHETPPFWGSNKNSCEHKKERRVAPNSCRPPGHVSVLEDDAFYFL